MSSPLPQSRVRVQRIAEAAVERARLTVVPRQRLRAPRVPFVTLVSLILLAGVVGLLMFNTSMQQNAFAASALEEQAADLRSQQQALEAEVEEKRDPQWVGEWCRKNGCVLPTSPEFLQLDGTGGGRVLGADGDAAPPATPFDPSLPAASKPAELVPDTIKVIQEPQNKAKRKKSDTRAQRAGNAR